jgi:hypothetical protein
MYLVVSVAKYNNSAEWQCAQWNLEGPIISAFVPFEADLQFFSFGLNKRS